jgi:hypothetical protein
MREILEEAAIIYRQEAEDLLFIVAPAAVAGPILVLISAYSTAAAFVCIPLLLGLYFAVYAASVQASSMIMGSRSPEPGPAYMGVLARAADLLRVGLPGGLLVAATWGVAVFVSDAGWPPVALLVGIAGGAAAIAWAARHAFDIPLVVVHDMGANEAGALGGQMTSGPLTGPLTIVLAVSAPLVAVALLGLMLAFLIKPLFAGVFFSIALAAWLPFAALALTFAAERLVDQVVASERRAPAGR